MSTAFLVVLFARPAVPAPAAGTTGVEPGLRGQAAATAVIQGDVNCSGGADSIDSLQILRSTASLPTTADCLDDAGDVDCSGAIDSVDALRILRSVAELDVQTPEGCTPIGDALGPLSPQVLAARLYAAPNDEARYHVLLKVMGVLRIGVYTSQGGDVQQGAERGPGDFYLYDFELRMMAASLGRRDNSWGVQQIADALDQVGFREDGQPFTGDDLNQILHDATNDALAKPEEASSLIPMLVRELGLRHETPYDLANDLAVNGAQFDGLQMTLILVGLTLPVIADEGPVDTPASTLVANSNGILTTRQVGLTDFCSDFKGEGSELWGPAKYFLTAVKTIGTVAKKVVAFIDIFHGEQLALSVQVKALDESVGPTHYDHGPESPGQLLKFRIEVRMLDDLGETLVQCGWLATADFPAKGGIPGVRVSFQHGIGAQLKDHGTLDCTGLFCDRTTGTDGIATLTFDPKSETPPYGQGLEKDASGGVDGIAWYQSKFKNIFGAVAQFLTPKYGSIHWSVRYHGCPLATSPASQAQPPASVSIQAITSLDELPCTWTGTSTASTHYFGTSGLDFDEVGSVTANFTFGNPQRNGVEVKYQITGGQAQWHASGHYSSNTVSCPPFSKGGTQGLSGQMTVAEYTPGNLTYSIDGWMNDQDRVICSTPNQPGINTNAFLETFWCAAPALTGESFSGSCQHDDTGLLSAHLEYDWNLTSAGCQPSPQPVCQ